MEDFLDESCRQEPSDFFSNGLPPFMAETAEALFDRFGSGQDIKAMLGDLPRDSWHVGRFPCKDVSISDQEVSELMLLPVRKATTDLNGFAGVFGIDLYRLGVLSGHEDSHRLLPCAGLRCNFGHGCLESL